MTGPGQRSGGDPGQRSTADPGEGPVLDLVYRSRRRGSQRVHLEVPDRDDHIARMLRRHGTFYEAALLGYLETVLGGKADAGVAIDVGANIGNHAVFFARFLAGHVIAVEPNPAVVAILERNLDRNAPAESWTVVAAALGATPGSGVVELPEDAGGNVGMARVRTSQGAGAQAADESSGDPVPVTTVDELVSEHLGERHVTLLKIDVEGMEPDVLRGAMATLERFGPDIVVEAISREGRARIEAILRPLGYSALSSHGATPVYHYARRPGLEKRLRARLYLLGRRVGSVMPR